MKFFLLGLGFSVVACTANAANIYVIDGGIHPGYYPQIQDRIIAESCYSMPGDRKRLVPTDSNNPNYSHFYEYQFASLCRNKSSEQHGSGASILRVDDLPGALGRGSVPDVSVPVELNTHQSVIADVIKTYTSPRVKQWHAHGELLVGRNNLGAIDWLNYNTLTQETNIVFINQALMDLGKAPVGLKGVSVLSFSEVPRGIVEDDYQLRYPTPCDNHPDILKAGKFWDMAYDISRLRGLGVTVVTATDNTQNDRLLDNYVLPFPSCLSTTVSVGGIDAAGEAQGAIGPDTDFIENFTHRNPVTTGLETGTSFATPKVASYIAELQTLNPALSSNQALNTLRNTGDLVCGSRRYEDDAVQVNYCITQPNFARARNEATDSFWNDFVEIIEGTTVTEKYGWNYGTSRHSNGVLSFFESVPLLQLNQSLLEQSSIFRSGLNSSASKSAQQVLRYSFRPYDIDTEDELEVLVNDISYGYVATTGSNQLGPSQTVCIEDTELKTDNTNNEVKLRLKSSRETWGVTDLKIEVGLSDENCLSLDAPDPNTDPTIDPPIDPVNESAVLTLGIRDTNQYGRNFGRNNNTNRLDVSFTSQTGRPVEISWQSFDIENDEMDFFLNNQKIKDIRATSPNQLGASESFTAMSSDLVSGSNTISFRVNGGNQIWGVTNLLAIPINGLIPSEAGVEVLVDKPSNHEYLPTQATYINRFDFAARGEFYDELIEIEFDSFVPQGGFSAFNLFLNGQHELFVPAYSGQSTQITHSVSFDKNELNEGENLLIINSTAISANDPTSVSNLRITHYSTPQLDVTVDTPRLPEKLIAQRPLFVSTVVTNVRAANSPTNTLSFYVSDNADKSNAVLVASQSVPVIFSGSSVTLSHTLDSSGISDGQFLWVCIGELQGDLNAQNNCSGVVQLDFETIPLTPIIILLLDEAV